MTIGHACRRARLLSFLVLLAPQPASLAAQGQLYPATLRSIDSLVEARRQWLGVPGFSLMIVHPVREVHHHGFGTADGAARPVGPDTPFLIGSISKPITAAMIMQLSSERRLNLDDRVRDLLPGFRLADTMQSRTITVRDLLSHRSGIPRWVGLRGLGDATSLAEVVEDYANVSPIGPARTTFVYSNANYLILGAVLERLTGRPYTDLVHERIFARLESTHAFTAPEPALAAGLAQGHRVWFGVPVAEAVRWRPLILPAGDLIFSARDLGRFVRAMLNFGVLEGHQLVEPSESVTMLSFPEGWRYALGWARRGVGDHLAVGHGGAYATYQAEIVLMPRDSYGVVLLANTTGMFLQDGIRQTAIDVARLVVGLPPEGSISGIAPRWKGYGLGAGVLLMTALTFRTLWRLPRWRDRLRRARINGVRWPRRPVFEIAWDIAVLIAVPVGLRAIAGVPLSTLPRVQADLGYWLWLTLGLTAVVVAFRLTWLLGGEDQQSQEGV